MVEVTLIIIQVMVIIIGAVMSGNSEMFVRARI